MNEATKTYAYGQHGYDRSRVIWGSPSTPDQTRSPDVLAQIECVVFKH